jgi:hypothetical protein
MSVLDHLWAMPGVFWGLGRGPNTDFVSRVAVVPHDDGSVTLDYEAWSNDEGLQHAEAMRMCRAPDGSGRVVLMATSDGNDDTMTFREGESGVFGSTGLDRVGLVLVPDDGRLAFSWWWPDEDGVLAQQSHAELTLLRPLVRPPASLGGATEHTEPSDQAEEVTRLHGQNEGADKTGQPAQRPGAAPSPIGTVDTGETALLADDVAILADDAQDDQDAPAADGETPALIAEVPWPGIVVLAGNGTGVVAQRLAERLTRAAVVRTDLFDKAVRGSDAAAVDPALRHRITIAVTRGYASSGHPVILHGAAARGDHAQLVEELRTTGLAPVRLVDVADGEDYGEVARRLIDGE